MTESKTEFDLHDIVLFTSAIGNKVKHLGVITGIGGERGYLVRFYNSDAGLFTRSMTIVGSEVEWIGPMPKGVEYDWGKS